MILLDTHALLWLLSDSKRLSARARTQILNNELCISVVSLWELAIKASLPKEEKRLNINQNISQIAYICEERGITILPVTPEDCDYMMTLPHIHEDPFDRMILAQSVVRKLPIITKDSNILK